MMAYYWEFNNVVSNNFMYFLCHIVFIRLYMCRSTTIIENTSQFSQCNQGWRQWKCHIWKPKCKPMSFLFNKKSLLWVCLTPLMMLYMLINKSSRIPYLLEFGFYVPFHEDTTQCHLYVYLYRIVVHIQISNKCTSSTCQRAHISHFYKST